MLTHTHMAREGVQKVGGGGAKEEREGEWGREREGEGGRDRERRDGGTHTH